MLKTISYSHSQIELRNLLFGTMIACAFAACSNEDDPIVGPDQPQTGDVETTLAFAIKGADTKTKAGTQTAAEEKVNNLRVILYTADGSYVASSTTGANEDGVDDKREVQMTVKLPTEVTSYKVLAVANLSTSFADNVGTSLAAMEQGAPFGSSAIESIGLPMSSGVSAAFTVELGKANYYGYSTSEITGYDATKDVIVASDPLPLIRNVARVDLKKVTLDLNASTKEPGYTSIDAQLQLQEVFILHARTKAATADLTSTPAWWNSATGTWGTIAAQYTASTTDLLSGRNVFEATTTNFENVVGTADTDYKTILSQTIAQNSTTAASQDLSGISFYILENDQTTASREIVVTSEEDAVTKHSHQYATELVIKGKYKVTSATNTSGTYKYAEEVRYWPIKIGIEGVSGTGAGIGSVHRNYIYEITEATIAGPGMKDPTRKEDEPLQLFVKTKVTDWNKVTQAPTIE